MGTMTAKLMTVSAAALAVSGCATYASRPPQLVYYAVPCSTPGAFQAQLSPVPPQATLGAAPGDVAQSVQGQASAGAVPTCLVTAQINDRSYGGYGPYYGYAGGYYSPYYGYGGYGNPFYGSVGIGIGFHSGGFGHGGGGHGGFVHGDGGHGGGHGPH